MTRHHWTSISTVRRGVFPDSGLLWLLARKGRTFQAEDLQEQSLALQLHFQKVSPCKFMCLTFKWGDTVSNQIQVGYLSLWDLSQLPSG